MCPRFDSGSCHHLFCHIRPLAFNLLLLHQLGEKIFQLLILGVQVQARLDDQDRVTRPVTAHKQVFPKQTVEAKPGCQSVLRDVAQAQLASLTN